MIATLARLGRMVGFGILGGIVAGVLVGGVANRLVMRLLAMVNSAKDGIVTENGNVSGAITAEGTFGLIVFGGGLGLFAGLIYVAVRPWLPGRPLLKGVVFGMGLLCLFGGVVFDPENVDFALFGPRPLGVGLFTALFPLYGVVAAPLIERWDRYVPPVPPLIRPVTWLGYLGLGGLSAFGLFHTVRAINAIL